VGDQSGATAKPSLAAKIDSQKAHPLTWQAVVKRAAVVAIAGISLYLVFPAITEVTPWNDDGVSHGSQNTWAS